MVSNNEVKQCSFDPSATQIPTQYSTVTKNSEQGVCLPNIDLHQLQQCQISQSQAEVLSHLVHRLRRSF